MSLSSKPFIQVLGRPHVLALLGAGFVGRVSVGILPLGMLIAVADTHGFAAAGLTDGVFTITLGVFAPLRGRLVDKSGRKRALGLLTVGYVAALTVVFGCLITGQALAATIIAAGVAGASLPPLAPTLRTLWRAKVATEGPALEAAHTWDSLAEEASFIVGPLVAGAIIALVLPVWGVLVAAALMVVAVWLMVALGRDVPEERFSSADAAVEETSAQSRGSLAARVVGPMTDRTLRRIVVPITFFGAVFGAIGVIVPAFATAQGRASLAGPLLALLSVGGVIGGVVAGMRSWSWPVWMRYAAVAAICALPVFFMPLAGGAVPLAALLVVCGLGTTPLYVYAYLLIEYEIPERVRTEANSWLTVATNTGSAVGAAAAGAMVASVGTTNAMSVTAVIAAAGALSALPSAIQARRTASDERVTLPAGASE